MKNQPNIFLLLLIVVLLSSSLIKAQYIGKRWAVVEDLEEKIVYLDTTSIRSLDNQLAIWSLIIYREPQTIEPLSKMVSHVKSQYLINNLTKHYSIIGALYYDERGRIIGESSNPRIAGGRDNLSKPIAENPTLGVLLNKALSFVNTGNLDGITDGDIASPDKVAFDLSLYKEVNEKLNNPTVEDSTEDSSDTADNGSSSSTPLTFNPNSNSDIVVLNNESGDSSQSSDQNNSANVSAYQAPSQNSSPPQSDNPVYDSSNESNVTNTIFTDGDLFCFQVSSWKRKSIADSEAQKLKDRGHKAFVVEAYIPSKRGTWYRVRVGFFNSLQETRDYKNRM